MCPRAKALISSDEISSPSPASPPPPSLTVTQRGTCEGTANFCRRMPLPGARGLHVSRKELSPLSLGQALRGETPSSCWAISFQLCPSIAVYSFTVLRRQLRLPLLLLSLPLVQVCRYPIHDHLFPLSLEEFCAPLTSSSAPARLAGGLSWLSFPHLLQSLVLDKPNQCNSSGGEPFPRQLLTSPRALLLGNSSPTLVPAHGGEPPTLRPWRPVVLGVYRQVRTLTPAPAALSSPPRSAPLRAVPHRAPHRSAHLRPCRTFPRWVPTSRHCCGCTGVKHWGMAVGWTDGRTEGWLGVQLPSQLDLQVVPLPPCINALQHQTSLASPPPLPASSPSFQRWQSLFP